MQQDRFSADRGQYRFVQSVVRQVAYGTLSRRDRKARHLAAADFLSVLLDANDDLAVVVAQHLLDAVDAGGAADDDAAELLPRACALLERAGARARALGSPAEARRLFDAALGRATNPAARASLYLAAAEAAFDAGDYDGAVAEAAAATDLFDALGRPIDAALAVATGSLGLQIRGRFRRTSSASLNHGGRRSRASREPSGRCSGWPDRSPTRFVATRRRGGQREVHRAALAARGSGRGCRGSLPKRCFTSVAAIRPLAGRPRPARSMSQPPTSPGRTICPRTLGAFVDQHGHYSL